MHILLGNVIKHASLPQEEINIDISIKKDHNNTLIIKLSNNVSTKVDIDDANKKISTCKDLLSQKISIDRTRKEDGSGYLKIKKVLSIDLQIPTYNIVVDNLNESYCFNTEISFNINGLEKIKV